MNEVLVELFQRFRHLRNVQTIVEEIIVLGDLSRDYNEDDAIIAIDHCVDKYGREISLIGSLYKSKVVVEDDPELYERKDDEEIHGDVEFIRDCLIIIGAVRSGLRPSLDYVVREMRGEI